MPKIRGIKPDLWTDEDFVELSPYARLLWLGMWNYACDNGHLADKSKQIKMRVLPTDDVNCAELLREIAGRGLIERVEGWITIPNLTRHQKPDRRYFTTCEKPGCEPPAETVSQRAARRAHTVHTPSAPRAHVERTPGALGDGDGDVMVKGSDSDIPRSAAKSRKKPATRLPDDWQPTDEHRNRAASEGINLDTQVAKFRAHADANDRRQVNWNAAFTQWLLNVPAWQKTPQRDGQLLDFPVNGTPEEKDAWARSRPMPTDGAYFGGSARPTTPQNGPESPTERPAHLPAGDRPRVTRSTPERRAQ